MRRIVMIAVAEVEDVEHLQTGIEEVVGVDAVTPLSGQARQVEPPGSDAG